MEKLGEILVSKGLITEDVVKDVLMEQELSLKKFGEILIEKALIEESVLIKIIAEQSGYGFIDDFSGTELIKDKSDEFYWKNCCALIKTPEGVKFVFNANNQDINSYITLLKLKNIDAALSSKEKIYSFLSLNTELKVSMNEDDLNREINDALEIAILKKSSNIRIKRSLKSYSILIDTDLGVEIIKVFSLETGERLINIIVERCRVQLKPRRSLDAKFSYVSVLSKKKIDIRVEFLPVAAQIDEKDYFEAVMRLHGLNSILDLKALGFEEEERLLLSEILTYGSGLVLSAGPTGAGKSTTFYAILKELAKKRLPILTIEDPVEIKLNEINITQMSVTDDFRYNNALVAMLRCEPKIILVGEIRDEETAKAVIKAAQTGHLVLSTIHTQSAINIVSRLKGMGISEDEFLEVAKFATSQRLYLPLCPKCREKKEISSFTNKTWLKSLKRLGIYEVANKEDDIEPAYAYVPVRGQKCDICFGNGYLPKKAIIEILPFTDSVIADIRSRKKVQYTTLKDKALKLFKEGKIDAGQLFNIAG
jgi:type II secretory ATPase GspE/PulE/Tfp pilus assembly ATPase PilB-like protein